ncbi:hypothetical protein KKF84_19380 [Myxococcota bacterium]|nr:hypothetical protein [Myxococcota bacterium]MBU1537486.1 hypothetical protein [Myxococcota bacterium]
MFRLTLPLFLFAVFLSCNRSTTAEPNAKPVLPKAHGAVAKSEINPPVQYFAKVANGKFRNKKPYDLLKPFLIKPDSTNTGRIQSLLAPDNTEHQRNLFRLAHIKLNQPAKKTPGDDDLPFLLLDFDQNGTPELVGAPATFFGPSPGYVFLLLRGGRYHHIIDGGGDLIDVRVTATHVFMTYTIHTIDSLEAEVHQVFMARRDKEEVETSFKFYWATGTQCPALSTPSPFTSIKSLTLRTGNTEHPAPQKPDSEHVVSKTLRDNIIATYKAGVPGFILHRTKGWAFGCLKGQGYLLRSSLYHGMDDSRFAEEGKEAVYGNGKPWICGWFTHP